MDEPGGDRAGVRRALPPRARRAAAGGLRSAPFRAAARGVKVRFDYNDASADAHSASPDGSTVIYLGPTQPQGVPRGNWIQTDPTKGWFTILRLYSPLEPFFDKTWRPSEIAVVK